MGLSRAISECLPRFFTLKSHNLNVVSCTAQSVYIFVFALCSLLCVWVRWAVRGVLSRVVPSRLAGEWAGLAVLMLPKAKEEAAQRQLGALKKGTKAPLASGDADGKAAAVVAELMNVSPAQVERAARVRPTWPCSSTRCLTVRGQPGPTKTPPVDLTSSQSHTTEESPILLWWGSERSSLILSASSLHYRRRTNFLEAARYGRLQGGKFDLQLTAHPSPLIPIRRTKF